MYKNSLGGQEAAGGTWKSGGQSRPPLQTVLENRVQVEKPPRCPFHAVGVDAYIDPPKAPILWWFSGETVLISHPTP